MSTARLGSSAHRKASLLILAALAALPGGSSRGVDRTWIAGSGFWDLPGNWNPNGVPAVNDQAYLTSTDGASRVVTYRTSMSPQLQMVFVGAEGTGSYLLTHDQGNLVASNLNIGRLRNGNPTRGFYNFSGGTLTLGGLRMGSGSSNGAASFSQTGGINNVAFFEIASGSYTLSAGTLASTYAGVGNAGSLGLLRQTGGFHTTGGQVSVTGTYELSGGTLAADRLAVSSDIDFQAQQHGTFHQSGGVVEITTSLKMNGGTYSLSGPGVLFAPVQMLGDASTTGGVHVSFGQTGGTNVTNQLVLGHFQRSPEGFFHNGSATYHLSGSGSLSATEVRIGNGGAGTFAHSSGMHSSVDVRIGCDPNNGNRRLGDGRYLLSGTGTLTVAGTEHLGIEGNGTFIQSGGSHAVNRLIIGKADSADPGTGSYVLSGGSIHAREERIGEKGLLLLNPNWTGSGSFSQSGGIHTVSTSFYLGYSEDCPGVYALSAGTFAASQEYIGYAGIGSMTNTGGVNLIASSLVLGVQAGSHGVYDLGGLGSLSTFTESVGDSGYGVFVQSGGNHEIASALALARSPGSTAQYTFTRGQLSAGSVSVGGSDIGAGGAASFNIGNGASGGIANIDGPIKIWNLGALSLNVGTVSAHSLDINGGDLNRQAGAMLLAHEGAATLSAMVVGASISATTLSVSNGGSVTNNGDLFTAIDPTSRATLTLTNSSLETTNFYAAGSDTSPGGNALVTINNGTFTVADTLKIWNTTGSHFTFNGGHVAAGTLDTDGEDCRFHWNRGTLTLGSLEIAPSGPLGDSLNADIFRSLEVLGTTTIGPGGLLTVSQGFYSTGTIDTGGDPSRLNWISGTVNITAADVTLAPGNAFGEELVLGTSKTLGVTQSLNAGDLSGQGGTLTVQTGATVNVGQTLRVRNNANAAINLLGGTINAGSIDTSGNPGLLNWGSGTLNLTNSDLTVDPSGPLGSALTMGPTRSLGVSGTTIVGSGGQLNLSGGLARTGTLNLQGVPSRLNWTSGTLQLTASGLDVQSGGLLENNVTLGASRRLALSGMTGNLTVGNLTPGTLTVAGGLVQTHGSGTQIVGGGAGVSGTVVVDGAGAALTMDGNARLAVGGAGFGSVTIQNGGYVRSTGPIEVGRVGAASGTILIHGGSASLDAPGGLYLGGTLSAAGGTGRMTVLAGGEADLGATRVWSPGLLTVNGGSIRANSLVISSVGGLAFPNGTITVDSGSFNTIGASSFAVTGTVPTDLPVFQIDRGATATWSSRLNVGTSGQRGEFNVLNGAVLNIATINLGGDAGSAGSMRVSGCLDPECLFKATVNASSDVSVGALGSGTLSVIGSGVVGTRHTFIGAFPGSSGKVEIDGALTSWAASNSVRVGGTNSSAGGAGVLIVENGANLSITNGLHIWNTAGTSATLTGATISTRLIDVSGNPSRFTWNSGTINLTLSSGALTVGASGPFGTSLTIDSTKTLVNAGTTSVDAGAFLAVAGGTLRTRGLIVGGDPTRFSFTAGTLDLTGSHLTVGTTGPLGATPTIDASKYLGVALETTVEPAALLSLTGGTLRTGSLNLGGTPARFNWTSGNLEITAAGLMVSTGGLFGPTLGVGAGKNLALSGTAGTMTIGGTSDGTLSITNGATVAAAGSGGSTLGSSASIIGTVLVDGSGSAWSLTSSGGLTVGASGVGSLTVSNGAKVSSSGGTQIAANVGSSGTLSVQNATFITSGTLLVGGNSNTAGGAGVVSIPAGALVNVSGMLKIWDTAGTSVNLSGGALSVATLNTSGNASRFNWTSGSLEIDALDVAASAPLGSNLAIGTGKSLSVTGLLDVQSGASLTLNGGSIYTGSLSLGGESVRLNWTTGNLRLNESAVFDDSSPLSSGWTIGTAMVFSDDSGITVGESGTGSLLVQNGGIVTSLTGTVANSSTSTGSVTITGAGSRWNMGMSLSVANAGIGTMSVLAGGSLSAQSASIASAPTSVGELRVDGAGSRFSSSQGVTIANAGTGTLAVTGGGSASMQSLTIGSSISQGAVGLVQGASGASRSTISMSGGVNVAGNSTLLVQSGALLTSGVGTIDSGAATPAQVQIEGSAGSFSSSWGLSGTLTVANARHGLLTVSNGGVVSSLAGDIALSHGSTGTVSVTGSGSRWNVTNELSIGREGGVLGAPAQLYVLNGGSVSSGSASLGRSKVAHGEAVIDGAGSRWTTGLLQIGQGGSGTVMITNGGSMTSGLTTVGSRLLAPTGCPDDFYLGTGALMLSGTGSSWSASGDVYVGGDDLGEGGTGVLTIGSGGMAQISGLLKVWNATSMLNLNGGTLSAATFDAGTNGAFVQTAGFASFGALSGMGSITISGGTFTTAGPSSISHVTVNGGGFAGSGDLTVTSVLNWTAGTMSGSGRTIIAPGGMLNASGGSRINDRPLVNNGTVNISGGMSNNASVSGNGVFVLPVNGDAVVFNGASNHLTGTSSFSGNGDVYFSGGSTSIVEGQVSHGGRLYVLGNSTTATFNNSVSPSAALVILSNSQAIFNASVSANIVIGSGALATFNGPTTASPLSLRDNSTLTGTGTVTVTGGSEWLGGTMSGSGETIVGSGVTFDMSGSAPRSLIRRLTFAANGQTVVAGSVPAISGTGKMDLTNNAMIVDYTGGSPQATLRSLLAMGYNNGLWTGNGIISSTAAFAPGTAVGYIEASQLFGSFPAMFAGREVDDTAILIRYTLNGDADFDRKVNTLDFNRLAGSFGQSGRFWRDGDFNYDGLVTSVDFNLLTSQYGKNTLAGPALGVQVPEPGVILFSASVPLLMRRRSRSKG